MWSNTLSLAVFCSVDVDVVIISVLIFNPRKIKIKWMTNINFYHLSKYSL